MSFAPVAYDQNARRANVGLRTPAKLTVTANLP